MALTGDRIIKPSTPLTQGLWNGLQAEAYGVSLARAAGATDLPTNLSFGSPYQSFGLPNQNLGSPYQNFGSPYQNLSSPYQNSYLSNPLYAFAPANISAMASTAAMFSGMLNNGQMREYYDNPSSLYKNQSGSATADASNVQNYYKSDNRPSNGCPNGRCPKLEGQQAGAQAGAYGAQRRGFFGWLASLFGGGRGGGGWGRDGNNPSPDDRLPPKPKPPNPNEDLADGDKKPKPKPPDDNAKPNDLQNPKAAEFATLVNKRRRELGLPELAVREGTESAHENNRIMNEVTHRSGHNVRINAHEIAFYGPKSAPQAMRGFVESDGHRAILDNPRLSTIYIAQDGPSWTAQFT